MQTGVRNNGALHSAAKHGRSHARNAKEGGRRKEEVNWTAPSGGGWHRLQNHHGMHLTKRCNLEQR